MELLKLLLNINLIFITVKTATGNNSSAKVDDIYKQSIKPTRYNIYLTLYTNKDDFKNTNIYKTFKSYIDKQQAKGNFIFYGDFIMYFEVINTINKIQLHIGNLKIDKTATKVFSSYDGNTRIQTPRMHIYDKETVVLYFNHWLHNKYYYNYYLIMKFVGSITDNTGSFFKISYKNNERKKE